MTSPTNSTYRTITNQHGFSPDLLEGLADPLVQAAHNVEQEIIIKVTQEAIKPQAKKGGLRRRLTRFTKRLFNRLIKRAKTAEQEATTIGEKAVTVLTAHIIPPQSPPKVNIPTAPKPPLNPEQGVTVRIPKALHETIMDMIPQVSKSGNQLYDQIVEAIAKNPPNSEAGRRRVAQQLLDTFNKKGITGFVDKAGRNWNLVSYVEMATRTATTTLAREAHVKQLTKLGLDVVRVTVMPDCNPLCLPFQGRLLSLTGRVKKNYHGEEVVATLAEALIRGFQHANCRHTIQVVIPGQEVKDPDLIDPGDYQATQHLRRLERDVRAAKRAKETALTTEARHKAQQQLTHAQQKIRTHIHKTGISRKRLREQINLAL